MKKKILSIVMAGALVFSISSVSQAAEITKEDGKYAAGEITAEGEYEVPTISVTLSNTTGKKIAINPYGLAANIAGTVSGAPEQYEQLVNKVETVTNDSEVALAVNATVKATPKEGSKAILATAEVKDTETKNAIFAYLQVDLGAAIDADATYNAKAPNQVVFAAKEATKKAIVTLADKNAAADKKGAVYKIRGNVAGNPTVMWSVEDKVDFSIVFDFEPRVIS